MLVHLDEVCRSPPLGSLASVIKTCTDRLSTASEGILVNVSSSLLRLFSASNVTSNGMPRKTCIEVAEPSLSYCYECPIRATAKPSNGG